MTALRSALFQVYFALLSVVICLGWSPALLGPWRWSALGVRLWGKATLWGLRVICGLKYEVRGREHLPVELAGTGIEILVDHLEAGGIDQHLGGGGEARLDEEHDGGAGKRADQGKAGDDEPALPDPVVEVLDIQREEGAAPLDGRRLAAGHGEGNR